METNRMVMGISQQLSLMILESQRRVNASPHSSLLQASRKGMMGATPMDSSKTVEPEDSRTESRSSGHHSSVDVARTVAHTVSQTVGNAVHQAVQPDTVTVDPEPRWPALVAMFAVGSLRLALPDNLAAGPKWLLLMIVGVLVVPIVLSRRMNSHRANQILGYILSGVVTADMIWSLCLLLAALPTHKESSADLLRSAGALWLTNILVFASWYWRLDGGGPNARDLRGAHTDGAFLFPQMTLDRQTRRDMGEAQWSPGFVDYLFVAFNTSTAFSPTDSPVLSRWAKVLMMVQALISFATVVLLAARAVNIL